VGLGDRNSALSRVWNLRLGVRLRDQAVAGVGVSGRRAILPAPDSGWPVPVRVLRHNGDASVVEIAGHVRKHRCSPAVVMAVALSLSVATATL
jgi:hypothetical protein